jgi:hypothetical protein
MTTTMQVTTLQVVDDGVIKKWVKDVVKRNILS